MDEDDEEAARYIEIDLLSRLRKGKKGTCDLFAMLSTFPVQRPVVNSVLVPIERSKRVDGLANILVVHCLVG